MKLSIVLTTKVPQMNRKIGEPGLALVAEPDHHRQPDQPVRQLQDEQEEGQEAQEDGAGRPDHDQAQHQQRRLQEGGEDDPGRDAADGLRRDVEQAQMVHAADPRDEAAQHLDAGLAGDQEDGGDHDRDQELDDREAEPGTDGQAVAGGGADIGLQLRQRGRQVDHGLAPLIVQLDPDHRQIPEPGRRLGQANGGEVAHQAGHAANALGQRIDEQRDRHDQDQQQRQRHEHGRQHRAGRRGSSDSRR